MNFIDTTVLPYAFAPDDPSGRLAIARRLLTDDGIAFSIQVFRETFSRRIFGHS